MRQVVVGFILNGRDAAFEAVPQVACCSPPIRGGSVIRFISKRREVDGKIVSPNILLCKSESYQTSGILAVPKFQRSSNFHEETLEPGP